MCGTTPGFPSQIFQRQVLFWDQIDRDRKHETKICPQRARDQAHRLILRSHGGHFLPGGPPRVCGGEYLLSLAMTEHSVIMVREQCHYIRYTIAYKEGRCLQAARHAPLAKSTLRTQTLNNILNKLQ